MRVINQQNIEGGMYLPYVAEVYYRSLWINDNLSTTTTITQDRLYAIPFYVHTGHTFDRIGVRVTTGVNNGHLRIGIYKDSSGLPGSLVSDAGAVTMSGTGAQDAEVTISQYLSIGHYWLAVVGDSGPALLAAATSANRGDFGDASLAATLSTQRVYVAHTYAALPTTFGTPTLETTQAMCLKLRA